MAGKSKEIADYRHEAASRLNNPTAALAREDVAPVPKRRFEFDPHVAPELMWAGKAEEPHLEVDAPSIHVHERLSTDAILKAAQQENAQVALFADPELERAKQVEFYEHEMGWANRLILGDSLVAMASLLERERMGGQAQLVYVDPPYGINYNSNFQARLSQHSPKETADGAVTREPEQIQAYRDTWQLGLHSYLTYLRQRLIAARELLADDGSIVVQIGPDNVHLVRSLLDEVFGPENACPFITVVKTTGHDAKLLPEVCDYLVWYARDRSKVKYRQLFEPRVDRAGAYRYVEFQSGERRPMTPTEREQPQLLPEGSRIYRLGDITSQGTSRAFEFEFEARKLTPPLGSQWKIRREGMEGLAAANRLVLVGNTLSYVRYIDDFGGVRRTNVWTDTGRAGFGRKKRYVVETNEKIVERVLAMTTDPGDLVIDPTCGSGTTAWASERLGRRWITTDTSRVALALARERILTAKFDYYALSDQTRGVDGGLEYETLPRITASAIGYGRDPDSETLFDRPKVDRGKTRVSGPFTVEALSRYTDNPFNGQVAEAAAPEDAADHVTALLDALRKMGIPRKGSEPAEVVTLDPIPGTGVIHAEGTYRDASGEEAPFAVSLGPRHGPVTVAQVDEALHEAPGLPTAGIRWLRGDFRGAGLPRARPPRSRRRRLAGGQR